MVSLRVWGTAGKERHLSRSATRWAILGLWEDSLRGTRSAGAGKPWNEAGNGRHSTGRATAARMRRFPLDVAPGGPTA